jgi:hypothetical protein
MLVGGFKNYVPGTGNLYYVVYVLLVRTTHV